MEEEIGHIRRCISIPSFPLHVPSVSGGPPTKWDTQHIIIMHFKDACVTRNEHSYLVQDIRNYLYAKLICQIDIKIGTFQLVVKGLQL